MQDEKCIKEATGAPSEDKVSYKERYRDFRKKAQEDKHNSNLESRRMYFLDHIVKSNGLNWQDVAKISGIHQQTLSWMMISDDAKLTRVKEIIGALGGSISPEYKPNFDAETESGPSFEIRGRLHVVGVTLDSVVDDTLNHPERNLYFLAKFLKDRRSSLLALSKKTEIPVSYLKWYFKNDDMRISVIYQIAEAYNCRIVWNLGERDSADPE